MKKLVLSLSLLAAVAAQAQQGSASEVPARREGTVTYERTMQMRRPQNMDPELAARIPSSRTDVFELLYTAEKSLWRAVPRADGNNGDITAQGPGGNVAMFRMAGMNDEIFTDYGNRRRVERRELFDNEMIVADSVRPLAWKLTEETKTVLGLPVRKAVAQRIGTRMSVSMENGEMKRTPVADTSTIVAWYTTAVPVSAGPSEFQAQLPGLILELDVNNGRTVYRAVEMKGKVNTGQIREPRGKQMTPAEFEKERDRIMQEMQRNRPPGMNIRVQN